MLADSHRKAAENFEAGVAGLQNIPGQDRLIIEGAWLAGFHWIAYGCARKHNQHRENHQGLVKYLNGLGEGLTAIAWRDLERARQGGAYGNQNGVLDVKGALSLMTQIHIWATT